MFSLEKFIAALLSDEPALQAEIGALIATVGKGKGGWLKVLAATKAALTIANEVEKDAEQAASPQEPQTQQN